MSSYFSVINYKYLMIILMKEQCNSVWRDLNHSMYTCLCTEKEERFVVCFLGAEGGQGAVIHTHLCASCEHSALSCRNVYVWLKVPKKVWTSVTDGEHL